MRALLLAAGLGSRLRPITDTTPKCLVEIDGRPLLDHWLQLLFQGGISRVLINTHWLAEEVRRHIAASPFAPSIDLVHEATLLGTAGTLIQNRDRFGDGPFLVAHADNLTDFDLPAMIAAHAARRPGHVITMLCFRTDTPSSCGIVELDRHNTMVGFHEKVSNPPGNLANGAVYIFEPEVLAWLTSTQPPVIDLSTEVLPRFKGRTTCVETPGYHRDIGTADSLDRARLDFQLRRARRDGLARTPDTLKPIQLPECAS
jgi:mannose-1-phosphate guanylyltransferase